MINNNIFNTIKELLTLYKTFVNENSCVSYKVMVEWSHPHLYLKQFHWISIIHEICLLKHY